MKDLSPILSQRQFWRLVDDPIHKREMEKKMRDMEEYFVNEVKLLGGTIGRGVRARLKSTIPCIESKGSGRMGGANTGVSCMNRLT